MKISIEMELEPNEFDLANELLRTLNLLTEHVKVKRRSSATGTSAAASSVHHTVSAPVSAVPIPAPTAVPQVPIPAPVVPPQPVAAVPAGPPLPATKEDARRMFTELLTSLVVPANLRPVADELTRLIQHSRLTPEETQGEFLEALFAVSFDPAHIAAERSVAPYLHVLALLPEDFKLAVKPKVIQKVLTHLNQKRPVTTGREEFYLQAEAFAVLSELEFVGIEGAIQTIEKLLKNSEKRAAAVTTLGRTIERCSNLVAGANPTLVANLFNVLDSITEPQFSYDIDWINNNMGRTRPAPQPAAAPAVQPQAAVPAAAAAPPKAVAAPVAPATSAVSVAAPTAVPGVDRSKLRLHVSRTFHSPALDTGGTFFTLGYDPKSQHLISGGKEVPVTVWASDGSVHKTIDCPGMYICCIDVELSNQLMLMCGIYDPPTNPYKSRIVIYDGRPGQNFNQLGEIKRADVDMTAVVRALPNTANLITGESVRLPSGAYQEVISLYDLNTVLTNANGDHTPIMTFNDHKNLVTCLAPLPSQPGVFVSGSRDYTVKVWDARRGSNALFTLGVPQGDFTATTHLEMVTCVDVAGDIVVSGSLDQSIAAWDLRAVGQNQPMAVAGPNTACNQHGHQALWGNNGILKASLDGSPIDKLAAVATVAGLYTVDFSTPTPIITAASALGADGVNPKQYNDIKWASHTGRLYASAGEGSTVDLLEIQQV